MLTEMARYNRMFDLAELQDLQNALGEETGMTLYMVDRKNEMLTQPTNWGGYCKLFHDSYFCGHLCARTSELLTEACRRTEKPVEQVCPHSGLITAAIPMIFAGDFHGALILCQIRVRKADDALLAGSARLFGVNFKDVRDIQHALPSLTPAQYAAALIHLRAGLNGYLKRCILLPMHA